MKYLNPTEHKQYIEEIFNQISPRYDLLNHLLSFGIDKNWRSVTVDCLRPNNPQIILDIATGTADLAIMMAKSFKNSNIIGIDIAEKMINVGRNKVSKHKLSSRIDLQLADGHQLPFDNNSFDAITNAFGLRNFADPELGVYELFRTVKNNGKVVILEFTTVNFFFIKWIYSVYFKQILPFIGNIISKHETAYTYLPHSVKLFNSNIDSVELLKRAGFINVEKKPLTFGIASIVSGIKPQCNMVKSA